MWTCLNQRQCNHTDIAHISCLFTAQHKASAVSITGHASVYIRDVEWAAYVLITPKLNQAWVTTMHFWQFWWADPNSSLYYVLPAATAVEECPCPIGWHSFKAAADGDNGYKEVGAGHQPLMIQSEMDGCHPFLIYLVISWYTSRLIIISKLMNRLVPWQLPQFP